MRGNFQKGKPIMQITDTSFDSQASLGSLPNNLAQSSGEINHIGRITVS